MLDMSPETLDRLRNEISPTAAALIKLALERLPALDGIQQDTAILASLGMAFCVLARELDEDAVEAFEQVTEAFDQDLFLASEDDLSDDDNALIDHVESVLDIEI